MIPARPLSYDEFPSSPLGCEGMVVLPADLDNVTAHLMEPIVYVNRDGLDLTLRLILPVPHGGGGPWPVIVYVQGSAWMKQQVEANIPTLSAFARKGYAVAMVEYRPSSVALFPAQVQDTKTAIRFLRKNAAKYNLDPERMVLWGDSSGGHTVVMTAVTAHLPEMDTDTYGEYSCRVRGVVDFYGPTDIASMNEEPSTQDHDEPDSPEGRLIGRLRVRENRKLADRTSPMAYINPDRPLPPFLIVHGSKDRLVPFGQSIKLYQKLRACGVEADFYRVEGGDHGGPAFWNRLVLELTEGYLKKWLQ